MVLSFCPATARREYRPVSPDRVVSAATWIGLLQFLVFGYLLAMRYGHFLESRARQWGPLLRRASEVFQSGSLIIVTLEFLIYPVSLLLLYFALEGFARFVTGLIASEVVPSLPVYVAFKLRKNFRKRQESKRVSQLPADVMTVLPDGRVRIATAHRRPQWNNPNHTIEIGSLHYELDRMDQGALPHPFVFFLRRAPLGKVLRSYERYPPPVAPED